MRQVVAAALAVASLTVAGRAAAEDDMATARRFLDAGRYTEAMYSLHAAADTGDAEAAETLALLYTYGAERFPGVARDPAAAAHWFEVAALGGRPVGRYTVCALGTFADAQAVRQCLKDVAGHAQPASR
jgi:TPR repeat protein